MGMTKFVAIVSVSLLSVFV